MPAPRRNCEFVPLNILRRTGRPVWIASLLIAQSVQAYVGENLLRWASDNIVLPLGLVAVIACAIAAIIKPEFAKTALWTGFAVCVVVFLIKSGTALMSALQ
jgi:hypothetical protein